MRSCAARVHKLTDWSSPTAPTRWKKPHTSVSEGFGRGSPHNTWIDEFVSFLVDATVNCHKPVVLVGAMRPSTAISAGTQFVVPIKRFSRLTKRIHRWPRQPAASRQPRGGPCGEGSWSHDCSERPNRSCLLHHQDECQYPRDLPGDGAGIPGHVPQQQTRVLLPRCAADLQKDL